MHYICFFLQTVGLVILSEKEIRIVWHHILHCQVDRLSCTPQNFCQITAFHFFFALVFLLFLWDIFLIYISSGIPFPGFPSENHLTPPPSPCSPTHPLLLPGPGIPLHWGIEPSQDQGPLLPLMSNKPNLCYIGSWSHGSLHVYFWLVVYSLGALGVLVGSYCCPSYGAANPFSSFGSFSSSSIGDPVLSPMIGCKHPPLYLSGSGKTCSGDSYIRLLLTSTSWHP